MRKMGAFLILLGLGLAVWAILLRRDSQPADSTEAVQRKPMNSWQQGVTLDPKPDYSSASQPKREVPEKLRAEAQRQKPEERRN